MCKKCDEKLVPVKTVLGTEMTRIEEITVLAGVEAGMPNQELVRMIQKNREDKVPGALGAKQLPDEVVNSEKTIILAMAAMKIATANYHAKNNGKDAPEAQKQQQPAADDSEDAPMAFDEETITALLGFEMSPEVSKEAYALAKAGKSAVEAFNILKHHHPMNGKVEVVTMVDEQGNEKTYVSEADFDAVMDMFEKARHRAASVAEVAAKLRGSVVHIMSSCVETMEEKPEEEEAALMILQAVKLGIVDKVPEAFAGLSS